MEPNWLNSETARLAAVYFSQAILGVVLFFIFNRLARKYNRVFLQTWALSWLAHVVFNVATTIILIQGVTNINAFGRPFLTVLTMASAFWQVSLILLGSYEITRKQKIPQTHLVFLLGTVFLISILLVAYKHDDPQASMTRYIIRVGVKYLIVSFGFAAAALITIRSSRFIRGIGQKMLIAGYLLYSSFGLYYAFIVFYTVFIQRFQFPVFFGLIELLSVCFIGLGMAMWLLEDEQEQLKKTNKELDSFLYSVSHDLRAPIASVLGLTNLARMELTDEKAKDFMSMIDQRIKKLDLVIGDILQLSRSTKSDVKMEEVDFNALIKEVISDVEFNKGAHAIDFRYEQSTDHVFQSDVAQLKIIIANLISNAVKYHNLNQRDPYIEVIVQKAEKSVTIAVGDNGEGIARENQEKIFDMFFRASTNSNGTGLGLYIVKEALSKLHGNITVESERGKGSVFIVTLPQ